MPIPDRGDSGVPGPSRTDPSRTGPSPADPSPTASSRPGPPVTVAAFLARGLLAGLIAGLAAFTVAFFVGEPPLSAAIALEGAGHSHADAPSGGHDPAPHDHAPSGGTAQTDTTPAETGQAGRTQTEASPSGTGTVVPRSLQATAGLATGTLVVGVALGGLLGVLAALAQGRLGALSPRATALSLAGVGLVALQLVPFWAYPPNPPGVGDAGTLSQRSGSYAILLLISVIAAAASLVGAAALRHRLGGWYAGLIGVAGYLVVMALVLGLLPTYDEVPAGYPAGLLYRFRAAGLLTQVTLWTTLGLALAELAHRLRTRSDLPGVVTAEEGR